MNCMRIGKTENRKCNIEKHTNTQRSKMLKTIMFLWRHTVAHYRFERKREKKTKKEFVECNDRYACVFSSYY